MSQPQDMMADMQDGTPTTVLAIPATRPRRRKPVWRRLLLSPSAIALIIIVLLAAFAGVIAPYGEAQINPVAALEPPSFAHLMGTDTFGRDIFSRVLYGGRLSLMIGCSAAAIGATIGVLVGMAAGYFGGRIDSIAMRIIDVLLAFPGTLLAIVIVAVLGPNLLNLVLAVGIASVPGYARLVRSLSLSIRESDYVTAARATGVRSWTIIFRHVFPNLRNSVIVYATLNIATAILNAAGLGFLGLGSKPPTAEWGLMVADGRETLEIAWWITAFPGLSILVTTLVIYSFGETLTAALDPRQSRQ
ncbi:ABC transporter permease [Microvirga antarctica]|uniref:ABC transporter permease n=1 Tax=Microvirga antarctica TaxID=2819233 RepID=UPI001B314299|nr:ABC transporter permease [Microvirga antarctica]